MTVRPRTPSPDTFLSQHGDSTGIEIMRPSIRIAVIDSHTLTRFGLFMLFARQPDMKFLADANNSADGRRLVATQQPDVVTVDAALRDRYALGIVLFRALESGASAFVPKTAPALEVLAAIRHDSVAASSFTAAGPADALARKHDAASRYALSPREAEVLRLLGDGLSIPAIARAMYVSHSTAKTYVARIYDKLGASNRTQAIMTAMRAGLIRHDSARLTAS